MIFLRNSHIFHGRSKRVTANSGGVFQMDGRKMLGKREAYIGWSETTVVEGMSVKHSEYFKADPRQRRMMR